MSSTTSIVEVLDFLSCYLDLKTLGISCCVSKSWLNLLSKDHLWKRLCLLHFPELAALHLTHPNISYRHVFSQAHTPPPRCTQPAKSSFWCFGTKSLDIGLNLKDLLFAVDISCGDSTLISVTKSAEDLRKNSGKIFFFALKGDDKGMPVLVKNLDELRIRWSIVAKGWKGIFTAVDEKSHGKLSLKVRIPQFFNDRVAPTPETNIVEFSNELPPTNCVELKWGEIFLEAAATFKLCNCSDDGKTGEIERVSMYFQIRDRRQCENRCENGFGLIVDDALLYLQHFLPVV